MEDEFRLNNMDLSELLQMIREKESENKTAIFLIDLIGDMINTGDSAYCSLRDSLIYKLRE